MNFTQEELDKEKWKCVVDYENHYEVSDLGRIRSLNRLIINNKNGGKRLIIGTILSQKTRTNGYKEVNLNCQGKSTSKYVHRLVAEAFISVIDKGLVVNHKDGIKDNNKVLNLEIITYSLNSLHSYHILNNSTPSFKGSAHPLTKLTDEDVLYIRNAYQPFTNIDILYEMFAEKISKSSFRKICYGSTWKHLL